MGGSPVKDMQGHVAADASVYKTWSGNVKAEVKTLRQAVTEEHDGMIVRWFAHMTFCLQLHAIIIKTCYRKSIWA